MQRVRIGLTGLACVFLLVVLAAAFLGLARSEEETTATAAGAGAVTANSMAEDAPRDPLAELGVAPGNAPADEPQQGNMGGAAR